MPYVFLSVKIINTFSISNLIGNYRHKEVRKILGRLFKRFLGVSKVIYKQTIFFLGKLTNGFYVSEILAV